MQQWEYLTFSFPVDHRFLVGPDVKHDRLSFELNRLGADGWELVSALDLNIGEGHSISLVLLLKRPSATIPFATPSPILPPRTT